MPRKATVSGIRFHALARPFSLGNRLALKKFLLARFHKARLPVQSLNFIFCTDDYLLDINRSNLGHDYYTDIITFNLSLAGEPINGEIYVSLDRVRDNARQLGEPFYRELHRVIFHGVLHLLGYRDKSPKETALMRKMEDLFLNEYFNNVPRRTVS